MDHFGVGEDPGERYIDRTKAKGKQKPGGQGCGKDRAHGGGRRETKLVEMTKGLFKKARSPSNDLPRGAVMYLLLGIASHGERPCGKVAPGMAVCEGLL